MNSTARRGGSLTVRRQSCRVFVFFQAEAGIRDVAVTGVQTCALPIWTDPVNEVMGRWTSLQRELSATARRVATIRQVHGTRVLVHTGGWEGWLRGEEADGGSGERGGGEEGRSRGGAEHLKKKRGKEWE